jgi:dolichyl-phosphate beta-glucosyltransferase
MDCGLDLSIIVPAYNEEARIVETLRSIVDYLRAGHLSFQLIVVADGADRTRERARSFAEEVNAAMVVIGSASRRGKGRAIREGVELAVGRIVGFVDADNKTPIEEMAKLLPWLESGYDIVIGSRAVTGSRVEVRQPLHRRIGSRMFGVAMHLTTGLWHIGDTQCGFKFFIATVARDLFSRQRIDGYMFDVEILYMARRDGYYVKEIGVRWRDDADSRLNLVAGNWQNMLDILRIRFAPVPPPLLSPQLRKAEPEPDTMEPARARL